MRSGEATMSKYFALSVKEQSMVCAARNGQLNVLKVICASEDWSLDSLNKPYQRPKTGMCWPCCGLRRQQKKNPRAKIYNALLIKFKVAFGRFDGRFSGTGQPNRGFRLEANHGSRDSARGRRELRAHRQPKEQRRTAHRAWLNFYASSAEPREAVPRSDALRDNVVRLECPRELDTRT
ncbi:hypothetical protein GQ600_24843 [Phytophthora cactorum]|nr:hypothetical protein GQ600_24843 [Phytophthora cactorum]